LKVVQQCRREFSEQCLLPNLLSRIPTLSRIRAVATFLVPHRPAKHRSSANACRKCRRNGLKRMPLHALPCVINKLGGGVAALFCNAPCCVAAIRKRIRSGRRRP